MKIKILHTNKPKFKTFSLWFSGFFFTFLGALLLNPLQAFAGDTLSTKLPPFNPKICLVTVDTALNKNVIVWEKSQGHNIRYFKIYKENILTHIYDSIGFRPWDSLSYYIDNQSFPEIRSAKYRLSFVDSNGLESAMSPLHQTIQLSITKTTGWNFDLTWTPYIGFPVYYYRIWRWNLTNGWVKIDSVLGGNFTYNDSPPLGLVRYYVETISPHPCKVTKNKASTNYNTSRSNRANTSTFTGIQDALSAIHVKVAPNPFSTKTSIEYQLFKSANIRIDLLNIAGSSMAILANGIELPGKHQSTIDNKLLNLNSGIYILRIKIDNYSIIRKLVITN